MEEIARLNEAVEMFVGKNRSALQLLRGLPWTKIAQHVKTRTWTQCSYKWLVTSLFELIHLAWNTTR